MNYPFTSGPTALTKKMTKARRGRVRLYGEKTEELASLEEGGLMTKTSSGAGPEGTGSPDGEGGLILDQASGRLNHLVSHETLEELGGRGRKPSL